MIIIDFNLNDLVLYETTIIVTNPYKVFRRGLRAYGQKSEPKEGIFQIPNEDVVEFIRALIDAIPYAEYNRANLQFFATHVKTGLETTFRISSASPKLYSLFVKFYQGYVKDRH